MLAILESPYAGDIRQNRIFAENVCRYMLVRKGINCFASHLYYTHFLDENRKEERNMGINAGMEWSQLVNVVYFALAPHHNVPSFGMKAAYERHKHEGRRINCGIFELNGENRMWLPEAQFFNAKGWSNWAKNMIAEKELVVDDDRR